jgi:hypothetical protein
VAAQASLPIDDRPPDPAPPMSISVVTPSFNQREFLESTLRSVIDQEYRPSQYAVVDGGSTDGSVGLIEQYESHLHYWVSEPDRGYADAVNKGFAHCDGDIMCWVNSSDMQYPWTLATVAEVFADLPQVEWIIGAPTEFALSGGPKEVGRSLHNKYDFLAGDYRWIQQESVFWRRGLWERAGGGLDTSLRYAADYDLWLRFFRLAELYHVPTPLGGFRIHGNRLGAAEGYERETAMLISSFALEQDGRTLRRARAVRAISGRHGESRYAGLVLRRLGICPWYRHREVEYDHVARKWNAR